MPFNKMPTATILLLFLAPLAIQAAEYHNDFNSYANGMTNLGDGSVLSGSNAMITAIQAHSWDLGGGNSGSWSALRLTEDGSTGHRANFILPELAGEGETITSFSLSFTLLFVKSSGLPADGFSFNFGHIINANLPYGGEEGMYTSGNSMLSVAWDTYGSDSGRIDILVDGVSVAYVPVAPVIETSLDTSNFREVTIGFDETGLSVMYDGVAVFQNYSVAFTPSTGDLFGFAARTGALTETVLIDDVNLVATVVPEPAFSALAAGLALLILLRFRKGR